MLKTAARTGQPEKIVPRGSLVKIVDPRVGFGVAMCIHSIMVTNIDYLGKVLDNIDTYWNMNYNAPGQKSGTWARIEHGTLGLFLGSVNVYNNTQAYHVHRAILLEKSVYIVPANCVKRIRHDPTKEGNKQWPKGLMNHVRSF